MLYIATTLLYNKDLIEQADEETGAVRLVESGFVHPGQTIELDEERAAPLVEIGAVVLAPSAEPEQVPEPSPGVGPEPAVRPKWR